MLSETWDTWETRNRQSIDAVMDDVTENHPALRADALVTRMCEKIRQRDKAAIGLAISLLSEDPRMPFGRGLKSHIARSFKAIAPALNEYQRHQLLRYRDKLRSLEYPPAELKYFERLGRVLEEAR